MSLKNWVIEDSGQGNVQFVLLRSSDGKRYARGYGATMGEALSHAAEKIVAGDTKSSA